MCMWVGMDVLWRNCSVLCRMYEHGSDCVIVTTRTIKGAEVGFSNSTWKRVYFKRSEAC